MDALKGRFLYSLMGAILFAAATIYFVWTPAWYAVVLFGADAVILTVMTFRFLESYQTARLIVENPILKVGVASVAASGVKETAESSVNVVVSGFGILMDQKPYKFGHGGVMLESAHIGRESISLSFGGKGRAYSLRLLHGIVHKTDIDKLAERLKYETGVAANVSGW